MPEVHARLSASGAKRWMACPPSVRMEEGFKDEGSSYASEGTLAHALAELIINYNLKVLKKAAFTNKFEAIKKDEQYSAEMQEYIEAYVNTIWETVNEYKAKCESVEVMTEQRLDFSAYVPDGFGTGDVVIIADHVLHIIDLKYGKGVGVDAHENPQLRLYGLGALETFGMLYDINYIKMTINQPRIDNITYEELPVDQLVKWGQEVVIPKAQLAMEGKGEFKVGDHCRFCKARKTCRARADANLELTKLEFAMPELLEDKEIGEILRKAEQLSEWVKDIQDYALQEAINGKKWDGWKLVEGRSNRKYSDEIKVAEELKKAGFEEAVLYKKELYGLTAMEKLVGKKKLAELVGNLIEKPQGKPVLVDAADKRPELNTVDQAANDFGEGADHLKNALDTINKATAFDKAMEEEAKNSPYR